VQAAILFAALTLTIACRSTAPTLEPPLAKKVPREIVLHGERLTDDYFWFREKENPDLAAYLDAEEAYTTEVLRPTAALQETLFREMAARVDETDASVPVRKGAFLYYTRYESGRQYPIYARRRDMNGAAEEVLLDVHAMASGHSYMSISDFEVSDDGNLLAFSFDDTGYRDYVLQVKDLRTGELLPLRVEKTAAVVWARDNRTLFYTTADAAKRPYRLWRHELGALTGTMLFEESDPVHRLSLWRSRSGAFLFVNASTKVSDEIRYLRADQPSTEWQIISARTQSREYSVDHGGDRFYIVTNDRGRTSRLVSAPVSDPRPENWSEIIPVRAEATIVGAEAFADHVVLNEREGGLTHLRVIDLASGEQQRILWPEPVYAVSVADNETFETSRLRVRYQSFVTPPSTYDYDMRERKLSLIKQTAVPGYDPAQYVSERIFATARDGARIPISLMYRRGIDPRAVNPTLLYAYGAYGSAQGTTFAADRLSLIDRGFIYALAHIRGGSEMGEAWYEQGKMMSKKNTFTDFIDSAEHLIAQGYTSKQKLAAMGLSAGGLLMGAVSNMRPDLFRVVVAKVPFVDVINTMLDPSIPLVASEWLEWGDPRIESEYRYLRSYDPYNNIHGGPYPDTLVRISMNDSQVPYWEGAKYVARRRARDTSNSLLLLKVNKSAGHSGSSGRYDRLREQAFDYAFILSRLGVTEAR
jgi:oligopeptidase B